MTTKESLKLINSFVYSFIVAFSPLSLVFLLPLMIVLFYEKQFLGNIFKKLLLLNLFILVLVLFVAIHDKTQALDLLMRTNLILLFNITLFHRSKGYDIVRGLDALHFPSKIVSVAYFTLSLITYLTSDFKETRNSLKTRGFSGTTSMFTYQTYGNIFAMIFIKALKKSEDIKLSMTARGFEDKIFFLSSNKIDIFEKILFFSIILLLLKVGYELFS